MTEFIKRLRTQIEQRIVDAIIPLEDQVSEAQQMYSAYRGGNDGLIETGFSTAEMFTMENKLRNRAIDLMVRLDPRLTREAALRQLDKL
jgi:hypothetical protein